MVDILDDWIPRLLLLAGVLGAIMLAVGPPETLGLGTPDDPVPSESQETPHAVFLINEDPYNYEAHETVPPFAERLRDDHGYEVTVLEAEGELPAVHFPDLEVLEEADVVVVFFRRAALPSGQMETFKSYLEDGQPLVGVRTANHAFSVRDEEAIPETYESWWEFVPEILGAENRGYGPGEKGTEVAVAEGTEEHPILDGIDSRQWLSAGNIYHTAPLLDDDANVLLTGTIEGTDEPVEPIAWTRRSGASKVFYTSLGYPDDFETPQFRKLLTNALEWAVDD